MELEIIAAEEKEKKFDFECAKVDCLFPGCQSSQTRLKLCLFNQLKLVLKVFANIRFFLLYSCEENFKVKVDNIPKKCCFQLMVV